MTKIIKQTKDFLTKRWVTNTIIIILFLAILIASSNIRLQNLPLLIDQTTGEYLPLALDPFYFLRVAETIIEQGELPSIDLMRYNSLNLPYINEILPQTIVVLYTIIHTFDDDITLRFVDVISPVIFYALGLVVFFFLVYVLTRSKGIALLSSAFLAFIQPYLYRTLAGFSDHESLGMFIFFSVILTYSLALNYLEKGNKLENTNYLKTILYSLCVAFLTVFMMVSWGGGSAFVFIIIPLSFFLIWIIKFKEIKIDNINSIKQYFCFYILWILFTIIFAMIFNFDFFTIIRRFTSSTGLIGAFVFGFIISDIILYYTLLKNYIKGEKFKKYRILFSIIGAIILGTLILISAGRDIIQILSDIWRILLQPFGTERIALTVAENAQPFLIDWKYQIGEILFWFSFIGMSIVGIILGNKIDNKKKKMLFSFSWILLIFGILFSRYAPNYFLNGENFISSILYLLGVIVFLISCIWIYFKDVPNSNNKIKLDSQLILLASLILLSVISIRSASRVFFFIVPFACLTASFFIFKVREYHKKNKDEIINLILIVVLILSIIGSAYVLFNSFSIINIQAKHTGPSANPQWQHAMRWVRENTLPESIFVHWWDYGYWIQYLGERPTITDGGHGNSFWDHLIGRYVLTTQNPIAALSFMKSHNVSYLLIDQTDLGKYPAYSKIGGDENYDSFSIITIGMVNNQQTIETKDTITRIYNLGGVIDEDIIYGLDDNQIFLPGPTYDEIGQPAYKAYIVGMIIEVSNNVFKQPQGIFVFNKQQIQIPLRYIYFQGKIIDFGTGLDSVAYILPKLDPTPTGNINVDPFGAIIYLSPKVSKSLFAQLYLMNNAFNNYPLINLAYSQPDIIIQNIRAQGGTLENIIYYQGFRGPIKIFKVNYPEGFPIREEFIRTNGEYAEFDYLFE